jgi:hypothetical protein
MAELRGKLDGSFEGGRAGWTASLPLLLRGPGCGTATAAAATVPSVIGGLLMSTTAKVLCAFAILVIGAVFVVRGFLGGSDTVRAPELQEVRPGPADLSPDVHTLVPTAPRPFREVVPESNPFVASGEKAQERQLNATLEIPAVIRGRCIDPVTSMPLANCALKLHGWPSIDSKVKAFEKLHGPVKWTDPAERSTPLDGTFDFEFVPPGPYQFMLTISAPGRATMHGRWHALKPGEIVDLGGVGVPTGTILRGRVVDEGGLTRRGIRVTLSGRSARDEKPSPKSSHQLMTDAEGAFVSSEPLVAGSFAVEVDGVQLVEPRVIEILDSEPTRSVEVRVRDFAVADTISGVVKDDRGEPVANASVDYHPRGGTVHRTLSTGKDGTFRLQRTEHDRKEPVTIWVRCTGYESSETYTKHEWGTKDVAIVLRKGATVTVAVRDGDLGKPLDRFGVRCFATRGLAARANDATRLRGRGIHQNGVLELDGVLRGRQFLVVEPEGEGWLPSRGQEFDMTDAGGPRQEVTVWRSVKKTVLVRGHDGKHVAGTKLELLRPVAGTPVDLKTRALKTSDLATQGFSQCAFLLDVGHTGDEGTLEMNGPPHEPLVLRALGPGHVPLLKDVQFDGPEAIEIVVPRGATLVGKLVPLEILPQLDGRDGDEQTRKHAWIDIGVALRSGPRGGLKLPLGNEQAPIAADGTFRVDGIPPGTWIVDLWYLDGPQGPKQPGTSVYSGGTGSFSIGKVDLVDGEERRETFDLTDRLKAEVRGVLTIDGTPAEGGALAFDGLAGGSSDDRVLAQQIGIGADGTFRALVWPGRYRLIVQTIRDGKRRCVQTPELLAVSAGEKINRTFDFSSSTLELQVVASEGVTPIAGVKLDIQVPEPSWPGAAERTDAQGRTSVLDLPAGAVTISAWPKRLSTPEAQREFFGSGIKREDVLLRIATVVVNPPETKATIILPPAAGY